MLKRPTGTVLSAFDETVRLEPAAILLNYFDREWSRQDVDQTSRNLASAFGDRFGLKQGSRVAICLQNTPAFILVILACWRIGAIAIPINPMYRERELVHILSDAGVDLVVAHPENAPLLLSLCGQVPSLKWVIASPVAMAGTCVPAEWSAHDVLPSGAIAFEECISAPHSAGTFPALNAEMPAMLAYTSGTTGAAKGVIITHANLIFQARMCHRWFGLSMDDIILSIAPLFHITGIGTNLVVSLAAGLPLLLTYRFDSAVTCQVIDRYRPTFAIGSITAFIALMQHAASSNCDLSAVSTVFSGGAPVPVSVVRQYEEQTGVYIHNAYGMTETSSAAILTPKGARAPIDPTSGVLSIGVPVDETSATIIGEDGAPLPDGEFGELAIAGPQVGHGYWNAPEATEVAFGGGQLRTGDIAFKKDGWVFLVDRKKDIINASGYKIWPREVEDVLYEHTAIREAAVVGAPDAYRGETVVAYVSFKAGAVADSKSLITFCRERIATYKVPRHIIVLDDLPKSQSGKILKRELRERSSEIF